MKKIMITLLLAILVTSMSISAWAAPITQGSTCSGITVSNQGCTTSQAGTGCVSGTDANALFGCAKSYACPSSEANSSQNCSDADISKVLSGNTSVKDILKSYGLDIAGDTTESTGCQTDVSAAADTAQSDCTSAAAATETQAADSAQETSNEQAANNTADTPKAQEQSAAKPEEQSEVQSAEVTAVQNTEQATCSDSCASTDVCTQINCADSGNRCDTESCLTTDDCSQAVNTALTTSGNTLYDLLSAFCQKCGINTDILNCLKTECTVTQSNTGTSSPTGSSDTTVPSDNGDTSTPSNSSDTTVPSDNSDTSTPSNSSDTTVPSDNSDTSIPSNSSDTTTSSDSSGAAAGNIDNLSFEQQVAALVNEQREANGLAPLTLSSELSNVARAKSQDMHDNNYFSHTSPTYGSPFDMLKAFRISYRAAGENIAMGYATPEAVVNGWMNSAGHRANILNSSYTQIGVGYVADGNYWTQEFIG